VFVFTGDTGPSEAVAQLAKNADVLVSEVGSPDAIKQTLTKSGIWQTMSADQQAAFLRHLEEEHLVPEAIGKLAAGANVKMVVLSHLPPTPDENDDYARFVPEVGKYYSGRVVVAKDLMVF
jgi:ribonuclease BN (tRNA processing enzyme)